MINLRNGLLCLPFIMLPKGGNIVAALSLRLVVRHGTLSGKLTLKLLLASNLVYIYIYIEREREIAMRERAEPKNHNPTPYIYSVISP